jgi:hypothetical protein
VSSNSVFRRRDPFWEVDGKAARRAQRTRQARALLAFLVALAALAMTAFAWSIQVGLAAALGIPGSLPF